MTADVFFRELKRVLLSQPKMPSHVLYSENCAYCEDTFWCKNLYTGFDVSKSSDSMYIYDSILCANCVDCDYAAECELCYECVDPFKCFNCEYLENCMQMNNSSYCYSCANCHDVFGCVNLKNKSFCIFNRQLTEAEYKETVKKYKTLPPDQILAMLEALKRRYPWTQTNESNNENTVYGNYIYRNKNCYLGFDAYANENSAYIYDSHRNNRCYDTTYSLDSNLSYEIADAVNLFNCDFIIYSDNCRDSSFLISCNNCTNCLGCVKLDHKQYCILNRQLTREDYERISVQILGKLRESGFGWADITV